MVIKDLEEMINVYKEKAEYYFKLMKDRGDKVKQLEEVLSQDLPSFVDEHLEEFKCELLESVNYYYDDYLFTENMFDVLSSVLNSDSEIIIETVNEKLKGKLNNCNKEWLGLWVNNEQRNIHVHHINNISVVRN